MDEISVDTKQKSHMFCLACCSPALIGWLNDRRKAVKIKMQSTRIAFSQEYVGEREYVDEREYVGEREYVIATRRGGVSPFNI